MKQYSATLQSVTPYSQGRHHGTPKLERETHDAYEERTYLQKWHTALGKIYIPPMAFRLCLEDAASYLQLKVPGKNNATYTKNFRQGLLFNEPLLLDVGPEDTRLHRQFTWGNPARKSGARVWKHYPVLDSWHGTLPFYVLDELLTRDILAKHFEIGGALVGIGVWRPKNGGTWGKFKLLSLEEGEAL